jgi:hypothetical protein
VDLRKTRKRHVFEVPKLGGVGNLISDARKY